MGHKAYETLLHNFEMHWSLWVADKNWIEKFHKKPEFELPSAMEFSPVCMDNAVIQSTNNNTSMYFIALISLFCGLNDSSQSLIKIQV